MKFNHFKSELKKRLKANKDENDKTRNAAARETVVRIRDSNEIPIHPDMRAIRREKVVGGVIKWKPADRVAARVVSKRPWWADPPPETKVTEAFAENRKPKRKRKHMSNKSGVATSGGYIPEAGNHFPNQDRQLNNGLKIVMVGGKEMIDVDSAHEFVIRCVNEMPKETRPMVQSAQDARTIVGELIHGLMRDVEQFKANCSAYIQDIRNTRFSVVTETAMMTKELKDVRQFFLASDYAEQRDRLKEFVDLCERLQKLKQSGFLDSIADTMLRLSV